MPGMVLADFQAGTGAEVRSSANYLIGGDTLGQFAVGLSTSDDTRSCAVAEHGLWHSDIQLAALREIGAAEDGAAVAAYAKIVTADSRHFSDRIYVADPDRAGGIAVDLAEYLPSVRLGDMVDVFGTIEGETADRHISNPSVIIRFRGAANLQPLSTPLRWLGGIGTDVLKPGGVGILKAGMLVRVAGRVTCVDDSSPPCFFYVDDGSGASDGTLAGGMPTRGVRISIATLAPGNPMAPPQAGICVTVTGICAAYDVFGRTMVQIRPRMQSDIVIFE